MSHPHFDFNFASPIVSVSNSLLILYPCKGSQHCISDNLFCRLCETNLKYVVKWVYLFSSYVIVPSCTFHQCYLYGVTKIIDLLDAEKEGEGSFSLFPYICKVNGDLLVQDWLSDWSRTLRHALKRLRTSWLLIQRE